MVTWKKQGTEVKTRYTVEYITSKKDWQRVCDGNHPAPWELYQTKKFDSLDDALTFYLVRFFDEGTFDVKLFEQIDVDGDQVREAYIEPSGCVLDGIRSAIDCDMRNRMNKTQDLLDQAEKELDKHRRFISHYKVWDRFDAFKDGSDT